MLGPTLFLSMLFSICLYALWRGGRDERLVATLCLVGTLATLLAVSPLSVRYQGVEHGLALVDLGVLAGFITVALTSQRFWPLWVAGFQLTTTFGHGLKAIDSNFLPYAYGVALQFWAYPILVILAVGTWRRSRRLRTSETAAR
jgi:hypothetical protein